MTVPRTSVLVTGGARSGKSRYALARARALPAPRVFVATAQAGDSEMAARIDAHREERGTDFTTIEEPRALAAALARVPAGTGVVVVDCVTLWIANLLGLDPPPADVEAAIDEVAVRVATSAVPIVLVTNEVGAGIVPFDPVTRRFRDLLGDANQRLAAAAGALVLMVAGVPLALPAAR
jgi:adenosylcobinamide kinase/adenosylcobinamide-phosphate guanylyltransferase